ncbi:MAG: hypothetical protein RMI79_07350, partial [Nitrososphaerota archaeon]|nr:hypothetical protein [Nitrososphaerota archaeon]
MKHTIRLNDIVIKIKKFTENTYLIGIVSLLWFLYRSGTKPSRAMYPCQKAALWTSYNFLVI